MFISISPRPCHELLDISMANCFILIQPCSRGSSRFAVEEVHFAIGRSKWPRIDVSMRFVMVSSISCTPFWVYPLEYCHLLCIAMPLFWCLETTSDRWIPWFCRSDVREPSINPETELKHIGISFGSTFLPHEGEDWPYLHLNHSFLDQVFVFGIFSPSFGEFVIFRRISVGPWHLRDDHLETSQLDTLQTHFWIRSVTI